MSNAIALMESEGFIRTFSTTPPVDSIENELVIP